MQSWEDPIADARDVKTSATSPAIFTQPEIAEDNAMSHSVNPEGG